MTIGARSRLLTVGVGPFRLAARRYDHSQKDAPELSLRGSVVSVDWLRSEVTGDAETAGEAVRGAMPLAGREDCPANIAKIIDRAEEAARPLLVRALIHQLEVEVQVGDRVPADVGADDPAPRTLRQRALGGLDNRTARQPECESAAATHVAPVELAVRALEIQVELWGEVVLEQRGDRPGGRLRPLVGERVEERVSHIHGLAVAVDLAVLAPHSVRQARVPHRVLGVGAGDQEVVAGAEGRQVDLDAGVDAPACLGFLTVAGGEGVAEHAEAAAQEGGVLLEPVRLDIDVVHHTRDLGLAPALGDVQVANDVGPTLAAEGYVARVGAVRAGNLRAAAREALRRPSPVAARALGREGGGEAAAERGGVG